MLASPSGSMLKDDLLGPNNEWDETLGRVTRQKAITEVWRNIKTT